MTVFLTALIIKPSRSNRPIQILSSETLNHSLKRSVQKQRFTESVTLRCVVYSAVTELFYSVIQNKYGLQLQRLFYLNVYIYYTLLME